MPKETQILLFITIDLPSDGKYAIPSGIQLFETKITSWNSKLLYLLLEDATYQVYLIHVWFI